MAIWILEIDPAAAAGVIDLPHFGARGIGPIFDIALHDPARTSSNYRSLTRKA